MFRLFQTFFRNIGHLPMLCILILAALAFAWCLAARDAENSAKHIAESNRVLVKQLERERAANAVISQKNAELKAAVAKRDKRLAEMLKKPAVQESAHAPLSPIFKYTLNELRQTQRSSQ
ncbi:MAG: hypothetical protein CR975_02060 [Gammaproteobacteria bacterium]|nr:MAG: hypothetical protein CR975_02060 [Gammaproteobacteria bacterium]